MEYSFSIPTPIVTVARTLEQAGFEAWLVGGCVRDMFMKRTPKDWDIATIANPEQIQALFPDSFYTNTFGTVGVKTGSEDTSLAIVEVTPFRTESDYADGRRPNSVTFTKTIQEDLGRRDFTINSLAFRIKSFNEPTDVLYKGHVLDLFSGIRDIEARIIRAVGNPEDRFNEDGLRILRAIRISCETNFSISHETSLAIEKTKENISKISKERIRDEFSRVIMSPHPAFGIESFRRYGLLEFIVPELLESVGVEQKGMHIYDVWNHLLHSLEYGAEKGYPLHVRLSALFHDIAKPATRRYDSSKDKYTFFGHEVVGSRVTKTILERLKYSKDICDKVTKLVRWHMFFADTENITLSAVRRMIANVGTELIWDLMNVRICDRMGMGRPKEDPYRLRKYHAMIEEALRTPVTVGMLKIDGARVMELSHENPGPRIGLILNALFEEVMDDHTLNTAEYLEKRTLELSRENIEELRKKADLGIQKRKELEEEQIQDIRAKHRVK